MSGGKRGISRIIAVLLLLAIASSLTYAEVELTINAKLNDYNADFITRTVSNADSSYNDGYDIPAYDLPGDYSQLYSTNGSVKLEVDSWNSSLDSRTINLTYITSDEESGSLNLSWDFSDLYFDAILTDYGYDSSYTEVNTTMDMEINSSYSINVNGADRYLQLIINRPICYAGMSGSNTVQDPCLITNCTQLQSIYLRLSGNYALNKSIDCSETKAWSNGLGFDPIGSLAQHFTGNLFGNNYSITNLSINRSSENHIGFFVVVNGSNISNIALEDVNISGNMYVGAFAAGILDGTIEKAYVTGIIKGAARTGGIAAENQGTIKDSYVSANISSEGTYAGGLVSHNKGVIQNSYSIGNVSAENTVGGIAAENYGSTAIINNSFSAAYVNAESEIIGGLVGANADGASVINSFWFNQKDDCCGSGTCADCSKASNEDYFKGDVYPYKHPMSYWSFYDIWHEVEDDFPHLAWGGIGGELTIIEVYNLMEIYSGQKSRIFEFAINNSNDETVANINWSLDTGENTIYADKLINLTPNEAAFVIAQYTYSQAGEYTVTTTAMSGSNQASESIDIDIEGIEVSSLALLNKTSTNAIFEFFITNYLAVPLTDVSWIFDTNNSYIINSTINSTLQPNESMFVYVEHNYTALGTYYPNAAAFNSSLQDSQNITITI